jgi:hypothetical protein
VTGSASAEQVLSLPIGQRAIVACARRIFGCPAPELSELGADWGAAVALAEEQGLEALLEAALCAASWWPSSALRTRLRAHRLVAQRRVATELEPLLTHTLTPLHARGLRPVVLKGAALAYVAFPESTLRSMGDVDILLPANQVECARDALLEAGFWIDQSAIEPTHHLRPMLHASSRLPVELHHRLLIEPHPYRLDLDGMLSRATVRTLGPVQAHVLGAADALLHTCLHLSFAHRYQFTQLRQLVDVLAITTQRVDELEWDLFVRLAVGARAGGAAYWPLELARRWLGAPIPGWVFDRLAPSAPIRRVLRVLYEPSFVLRGRAPAGPGLAVLYNALVTLSLYDGCSRATQAKAVLRELFPPPGHLGHLEPRVANSRLQYAAYLVRPLRVARGLVAMGRHVRGRDA